jgi:hypothetical protein
MNCSSWLPNEKQYLADGVLRYSPPMIGWISPRSMVPANRLITGASGVMNRKAHLTPIASAFSTEGTLTVETMARPRRKTARSILDRSADGLND